MEDRRIADTALDSKNTRRKDKDTEFVPPPTTFDFTQPNVYAQNYRWFDRYNDDIQT